MHIARVAESTFYCYQKYTLKNHQEAREHGNTGLLKPRQHMEQVVGPLKCLKK